MLILFRSYVFSAIVVAHRDKICRLINLFIFLLLTKHLEQATNLTRILTKQQYNNQLEIIFDDLVINILEVSLI